MSDWVREWRIFAVSMGVDASTAQKLEREMRRLWGGERVYIPKRPPVCQKLECIAAEQLAGKSPADAFRACGIPGRTGRRIVSRKVGR
jgi:hypothetical protein